MTGNKNRVVTRDPDVNFIVLCRECLEMFEDFLSDPSLPRPETCIGCPFEGNKEEMK